MIWAPAHGAIAGGHFGKMASAQAFVSNYLTMTYGNEKLRFFVAGRCRGPRIYLRQETTPLIQCVRMAIKASQEGYQRFCKSGMLLENSLEAKRREHNLATTKPTFGARSTNESGNWIIIS